MKFRRFSTPVVFFSLGAFALLAGALASSASAQVSRPQVTRPASDSDVAPAAPAPLNLQSSVSVMVELTDAPASVTWAAAYKQAQAQLDAQRNYALAHPKLKTSVAFLKKASQQAQLSSTAVSQIQSIAQTLDQKQLSMLPALTGANVGGQVLYRAQTAYNGIAMVVSPDKIASIAAMPGVKAVHPLVPKTLSNTFSDIDFLNTRPAWTSGGFGGSHGENIKVADIDSGLDYIHRDFGGSGQAADYTSTNDTASVPNANFPSPKVPGGIDFVGDSYNASTGPGFQPIPHPDNNPLDCAGHGTGTASLIAGYGETNAGFTYSGTYDAANPDITTLKIPPGFAPAAKLYPVRVFGCAGSSAVVGEGIEWAMTQGTGNPSNRVDVINMSLGSNEGYADDPDSVMVSNAAAIGILVICSAGNGGDSYYIHGTPASSNGAISVAATYNNQNGFIYQGVVNGNQPAALAGMQYKATKSAGSPPTPGGSLTGDAVYGIPHDGGPAMTPADSSPLTNAAQCNGKIVLLDRGGGVTFEQKVKRAYSSGAIGVIIANNANNPRNDFPPINVTLNYNAPIPEFGISLNDGNALKAAAAFDPTDGHSTSSPAANVTLVDGTGAQPVAPNPAGSTAAAGSTDTMPSYSSRGPRLPDSATKPDLSAPAEVTAIALNAAEHALTNDSGSAVANFNGTSSSAPHVTGELAVLRQLHPTWSNQELMAAACNTATHDPATTVGGSNLYGVGRVGAGRIDVGKAAQTTVVAYNGTNPNLLGVSFGPVEVPVEGTTVLTKNITVTNKGATNITYNTSVQNNPTVSGVAFTVSPANFTINAGTTTTVTVTLTATGSMLKHTRDTSVASTQSGVGRQWLTEAGGFAVFTPTDSSPVLRVELYANPKPASTMHATSSGFIPTSANTGSFTVNLSGSTVNTGGTASTDIRSLVKAFELQYQSPLVGSPSAPTNENSIKYVGITSDYVSWSAGPNKANTLIMFGIDRFGSSAAPDAGGGSNTEIFIDTNPADVGSTFNPNFAVFPGNLGQDSTINLSGLENVYFPILVDLNTFNFKAEFYTNGLPGNSVDTNIYNNTGVVMPIIATDLGLIGASGTGNTQFQYQIVTFDRNGDEVDESNVLTYDLANPGLETENSGAVAGVTSIPAQAGPFSEPFWYQDASTNSIPVNWNGVNFRTNGSIGVWLFHTHNADGNRSDVVTFRKPTISSFSPTSAHVGDFITISGSNYNSGTAVTFFNNVPATNVNVITSTTISVQVPPGAASGPIRVSNAAGSSAKGGFTVLP